MIKQNGGLHEDRSELQPPGHPDMEEFYLQEPGQVLSNHQSQASPSPSLAQGVKGAILKCAGTFHGSNQGCPLENSLTGA